MDIEEIEQMFGLSELKQTRVYQQAFAEGMEAGRQEGIETGRQEGIEAGRQQGELEGKLLVIPAMLVAGLTVEQIAQALELSVEDVRKAAQQQSK